MSCPYMQLRIYAYSYVQARLMFALQTLHTSVCMLSAAVAERFFDVKHWMRGNEERAVQSCMLTIVLE